MAKTWGAVLAPELDGEVVLLELDLRPVESQSVASAAMSLPVPRQQSLADAARSESPSAHPDDALPSDFAPHDPHSPIEREIERSERASAALAATRALARAAFTDSQLAAEEAAGEHGFEPSGWVRTEYAALDHPIRDPQDAAPPPVRNLVGGSFNPGIATQHGRAYPGVSISQTPMLTRSGAQARFLQESRKVPRGERAPGPAARPDHPAGAVAANYDKPAVMPMLAPAAASRGARVNAATRSRARDRAPAAEPLKLLFAAGIGAVIALLLGGAAWKVGLLSRHATVEAAAPAGRVAAQAEAARVLAPAQPEIAIAPAAGATPPRSDAEVDAALAAAARAAAVPAASVRAAGPVRQPQPEVATPAKPAPTTASAAHAAVHGKDSVADAIANAQARADKFLEAGTAPAPAAPEVKQEP